MRVRARQLLAAAMALGAILLTRRAAAVIAIDLTTNSNLGFGQIVATATAGTVTVSPLGGRTASGGVLLGNGFGASVASFAVSGQPNAGYSVTLPSSCVLSGGGSSMTADTFLSNPASAQNLVGPAGTASFTLGATLHVGGGQRSASYSGTYAVNVAYD
ncbi:MAG TPA: DUF4402 domain-containing protein [Thermoanaerobaculia bacterium]|nr:DUF4402 domain-containing protein [Thermoanaerobaculia bacterium]